MKLFHCTALALALAAAFPAQAQSNADILKELQVYRLQSSRVSYLICAYKNQYKHAHRL